MAEQLASDCGFVPKTDEYKSFVACINNILEYGCTYSEKTMDSIREHCRTSQLPLARSILRECDRASNNESRIRPSHLQWWESYRKPQRRSRKIYEDRRPRHQPPPEFSQRRSKQPQRSNKRPMSPLFDRPRKRPMSPLFDKKRGNENSSVPNWASRKRRRR